MILHATSKPSVPHVEKWPDVPQTIGYCDSWCMVRGSAKYVNGRKYVNRGAWWLSGKFGALHPEGRRFESHSSHHVGTLSKTFIRSWL